MSGAILPLPDKTSWRVQAQLYLYVHSSLTRTIQSSSSKVQSSFFFSHGLDIITIFINPFSYAFLRLLEQCPSTGEEHSSLLVVEESKLPGLQRYRV